MSGRKIAVKNVKVKDGKVSKAPSRKLSASAKIAARKSKNVRVVSVPHD